MLSYLGGPSPKVCSSAKFGVAVFKASILNSLGGGPLAKEALSAKFGVVVLNASILDSLGVFIGQSKFICQVWCSSIQGIYSGFTGGPLAKVCSSAKFCVLVFKASMLYSLELGPSAKVCSSAKFCVLVFKASMLYSLGLGPSAKVCSSAKFGVGVFKASILDSLGGPSAKSSFIHQVWCTGYSRYLFLIHWWVYLPKVCSSAKFGVAVFKASILDSLRLGPSAKVGSSANFGVLLFKASLLF